MLRNGLAAKGTAKGMREAAGKEIREVLDTCCGAQGEELRTNTEEMKRKFEKTWERQKPELDAFLEF